MNMKLSEWNKTCEYAKQQAKVLTESDGIPTRAKIYTMYNNDKGIEFQTLDDEGNFFERYCTGIANSAEESNLAIDKLVKKIKDDY